MADDLGDDSLTPGADLAVKTFEEVESNGDKLPSPSFITKAMVPESLTRKRGYRIGCISHETTRSVGVQSQKERNKQVVCIPEGFESLLANPMVGGGVHQHHTKKHDMAGDTTCSGKVYLSC